MKANIFQAKGESINKIWLVALYFFAQSFVLAQSIELRINGYSGKVFLSSLAGEKTSLVNSSQSAVYILSGLIIEQKGKKNV